MARESRETWSLRVVRWKDCGLTAKEFAAEVGIKPHSLSWWKWRLASRAESAPGTAREHGQTGESLAGDDGAGDVLVELAARGCRRSLSRSCSRTESLGPTSSRGLPSPTIGWTSRGPGVSEDGGLASRSATQQGEPRLPNLRESGRLFGDWADRLRRSRGPSESSEILEP